MGRLIDFGIRRLVGYIITWIIVIIVLVVFYGDSRDTPSVGVFLAIWVVGFLLSLRYTAKMKARQEQRRRMREWRRAQRRAAKMARRVPPQVRPQMPGPQPRPPAALQAQRVNTPYSGPRGPTQPPRRRPP